MIPVWLFLAAVWAGAQNAVAGGGSFVTLPALILSGLDPRSANIASTLALFPGQMTTAFAGRGLVGGGRVGLRSLIAVSLLGGALGAALLLLTPNGVFARLVPFLVLFATAVFAYGAFVRRPGAEASRLGPTTTLGLQFLIAIYGGYFGGGIGFLMLAMFAMAGHTVRAAGATKNVLAAVMNAAAVSEFVFTPGIPWINVVIVAAGAVVGGYGGVQLLRHANETVLRMGVVALGVALTIGLFLRGAN